MSKQNDLTVNAYYFKFDAYSLDSKATAVDEEWYILSATVVESSTSKIKIRIDKASNVACPIELDTLYEIQEAEDELEFPDATNELARKTCKKTAVENALIEGLNNYFNEHKINMTAYSVVMNVPGNTVAYSVEDGKTPFQRRYVLILNIDEKRYVVVGWNKYTLQLAPLLDGDEIQPYKFKTVPDITSMINTSIMFSTFWRTSTQLESRVRNIANWIVKPFDVFILTDKQPVNYVEYKRNRTTTV